MSCPPELTEPIRHEPVNHRAPGARLWPRSTSVLLLIVGAILGVGSFAVVMNMPDLPWHPARDAELVATYQSYRESGVLLVKHSGSGSNYAQAPSPGQWTSAAGDDDPGSYLVASLMSHVTNAASPYPGLKIAIAVLCGMPLLLLPLSIARLFSRARAGYSTLLLPAVMWLINHGTILIGTEYGLSDNTSPTRVYALYGFAASMAFLSLTLLLYFSTLRLRLGTLIGVSVVLAVLGGAGNLMRSLSGFGIAAAVGALWWLNRRGRGRWLQAAGATVVAVAIAFMLPIGVMNAVDSGRAAATGQSLSELPDSHGVWHPLYLGLSYPQPITGEPSVFGITWSDEFAWNKAREVDPDTVIASASYDAIMKTLYLKQIEERPSAALVLYGQKALYTIKYFGGMIAVVLIGFCLAVQRRGVHRKRLGAVLLLTAPTIAIGLVPPVLVVPLLHYYSELSAALGLLVAVGLGALIWVMTSMPSHVRAAERAKIAARLAELSQACRAASLTVVVPTRNGADVIRETVESFARVLSGNDEIVVIENGSTDSTTAILEIMEGEWQYTCRLGVLHSPPGLGIALRAGVLASGGARVLLSADDLPFGLSDLDQFRQLPRDSMLAIGSKAHPASNVHRSVRRTFQSRVFRIMREAILGSSVGDSQGTFWVDGDWCRLFAAFSRETGLMWTSEMVLAAEQQGVPIWEVPVTLRQGHDSVASRFHPGDAVRGLRGLVRLGLQKDDYIKDDWVSANGDVLPPTMGRPGAVAILKD